MDSSTGDEDLVFVFIVLYKIKKKGVWGPRGTVSPPHRKVGNVLVLAVL